MTGDLADSVKGRCIEISQGEKYAAVGFKDGTVRVELTNIKLLFFRFMILKPF